MNPFAEIPSRLLVLVIDESVILKHVVDVPVDQLVALYRLFFGG